VVFAAACSVGGKVNSIANVAIQAMASSATAFSGQNLGARRYDRLVQGARRIPLFTGALTFAALAGVIGAKLGKARICSVLDAMAGPLVWLAISATIAARTIGMGFGPEISSSILTVAVNGVQRLDTAGLMMFVMYLLLIAAELLSGKNAPVGVRFAMYAFLYGSVMILMESLREDGHMLWGFVHAEMIFDLIFALAALLYLARTKKRILLSLLATAVLAGAVVALEFALDRSNLGDGLLYGVYVVVLAGYIGLGCHFARKSLK